MPVVKKHPNGGETVHYSNEDNRNPIIKWGNVYFGMGPNGEYFHSVDNPLMGETTVTIEDKVTGEVTATVHPKREYWLP